jgi:excisionase family DNA binding protein
VSTSPEQIWLSLQAAAAYSSLSRRTICRLIEAGRLAGHKPRGGRVLVDKRQLDEVIRGSATRPRSGSV